MAKTAEKQVKEFTDAAEKSIERGVENMTKTLEGAATFGQQNVEAVVASSKIAAKAAETVNAQMLAFSKKSYDEGLAAAKQLSDCKSISEYVALQTDFAKAALESFASETSKLNEIYSAAAKDAFAPLNARVDAAVEMAKSYNA